VRHAAGIDPQDQAYLFGWDGLTGSDLPMDICSFEQCSLPARRGES